MENLSGKYPGERPNNGYEPVIGLEMHAELSTRTKIFCGCTTKFGLPPNTACCPVCVGMPGALPVLNKKAVEYAVKAGIALNCTISRFSRLDRKNYFYPDLPKGYQISQYDMPLCRNGFVEVASGEVCKRIRVSRIHIEEDAGKLVHCPDGAGTLVDYNRCGIPLIEIVTEPDIRSAGEAKAFVEHVIAILEYLEVSDCKMQEGSIRIDINLSVRPAGAKTFGTRTEMKNLNSIRSIQHAIESETARQIAELGNGREIARESRRWDDSAGRSFPLRGKEEAHDYRYFPEPDLLPVIIDDEWLEKIRESLPELPSARKARFVTDYGLPENNAGIIASNRHLAGFFEEAAKCHGNPRTIGNWIMGDVMRILNVKGMEPGEIPFPPGYMSDLASMVDRGVISRTAAAMVLEDMFEKGIEPGAIIAERGLGMIRDDFVISAAVKKVLDTNPGPVAEYRKGREKVFGFLVGQAMRELGGRADPHLVGRIMKDELASGS